ncbi:MAG: hypothetical protein EBT26_04845 [Microbacteriaceae bacterium]|nr:hypothetical protein [Microbacteriaceae bacterium]NBS61354.1 hypothetical protein [Microbacteriaceae bacterium]
MASFDISGSASRQTGLESKMRNDSIRRELDQAVSASQQQVPSIEPMSEYARPVAESQEQSQLPLPMQTVDWEARKDPQGYPMVYRLPTGDMGGNFEVAGINDRYHPEAFRAISALPPQERAKAAAEYIQGYTAPLVEKLPQALQPFTQDLAFNRGLGGATKYIQQGLNTLGQKVAVDGGLGPKTLAAINQVEPRALMRAASDAQLQDEYRRAELDPNRRKFIPGLEARIRNRLSTFGQG